MRESSLGGKKKDSAYEIVQVLKYQRKEFKIKKISQAFELKSDVSNRGFAWLTKLSDQEVS